MVTAARHADHVVDLYFAARADAQVAVNAGIEIDRHGWMAAVRLRPRRARKAARVDVRALRHGPELGTRIVGLGARGLVGHQELDHHAARSLGAIGLGLDLHPRRRRADAARGEHALAFDLDHADAAIAVGAIAGLGRVAEVRELDALACRDLENGLARTRLGFLAVEGELDCFACAVRLAHRINSSCAAT